MPSRAPSVLVVDDEVDICRNLSDILTAFGYDVDTATDGAAALELIRRRPYDVALLDLKMSGMDGLTLYREIKRIRAETVALIVTAYASSETARQALDAGASQIIPKPLDVQNLVEQVERVIGQPTVLVIDDDRELCDNLWQILRQKELRVCLAHTEEEAGRMVRDNDFRVVLLDLKLPGCDSGRLFRIIQKSNPASRVVLITGYRSEMEQTIDQVLNEGAESVCYKPFDVPELLATVQRLTTSQET